MYLEIFFIFRLILATWTQDIQIIRDYFSYKHVRTVVGFSCGDIESDYRTIRMLNTVGISASIRPLNSETSLQRFLVTEYSNLGVFLDVQCREDDAAEIFSETAGYSMYDHLYNWLILGRTLNHTLRLLNDSAYSIITDVKITVPENNVYHIYDVYNHCKLHGGELNVTKFGTWRKDRGLDVTLIRGKFSERWNYHGMKIKAGGMVLRRPESKGLIEYLKDDNSEIMDNWAKFGYAMLAHTASMFNMTMEFIELTYWAENDSNGPLMNGLKSEAFDMGYYPSILTVERLNYARVITQVWPVRTCFMFRTLPSSRLKMNVITKPFAKEVWYTIAFITIFTIITLATIFKLEKVDNESHYMSSFIITIAALCQQGLPSFTNQIASRIAFLQTMIFGLLVYNYYSAAIVSARLNTSLDKMNDSLYSLVQSKMPLAAEHNIFFNFLLRKETADVQYFRRHWRKIPEWKKFLPVEEGVRRIRRGGFAYHADPSDAYPFIRRTFTDQMICELTEVHLLRPSMLGLWSSRRGQFLEITKIGLIRISTAGLRQREVLRWTARKPYCNPDEIFETNVTFHEASPILVLLFCGMFLSAIICVIENVVFYLASGKKQQVVFDLHQSNWHNLRRKRLSKTTQTRQQSKLSDASPNPMHIKEFTP